MKPPFDGRMSKGFKRVKSKNAFSGSSIFDDIYILRFCPL